MARNFIVIWTQPGRKWSLALLGRPQVEKLLQDVQSDTSTTTVDAIEFFDGIALPYGGGLTLEIIPTRMGTVQFWFWRRWWTMRNQDLATGQFTDTGQT